jgi:methylmalonyl-CoA mutase N-terminal domain/subunit
MMAYLSDGSGRTRIYRLVIDGILDYFRQIDEFGGILQAKADGFFRDEIARSSALYDEQVHNGVRRIVAVNSYREGRTDGQSVPRVEISPEVKRKRRDDVKLFKQRRDPAKVMEDIRRLQTTAETGGNVFDVTLDIVRNVTIDEWTRALQEVYGMYRRKI